MASSGVIPSCVETLAHKLLSPRAGNTSPKPYDGNFFEKRLTQHPHHRMHSVPVCECSIFRYPAVDSYLDVKYTDHSTLQQFAPEVHFNGWSGLSATQMKACNVQDTYVTGLPLCAGVRTTKSANSEWRSWARKLFKAPMSVKPCRNITSKWVLSPGQNLTVEP